MKKYTESMKKFQEVEFGNFSNPTISGEVDLNIVMGEVSFIEKIYLEQRIELETGIMCTIYIYPDAGGYSIFKLVKEQK